MTYDPTIPNASHNISTDQGSMLTNFSQANTIFGFDHFAFNDPTSTIRGWHKQIRFSTLPSISAPTGVNSVVYPAADANDTGTKTQLYFQNATQTIQLTNIFSSIVSNGYFILPSGLVLMWGNKSGALGTGASSLTFNTIANYSGISANSFPNNCFGVWFSPYSASGDNTAKTCRIATGTLTKSGCTVSTSGGIDGYFWFAIGN